MTALSDALIPERGVTYEYVCHIFAKKVVVHTLTFRTLLVSSRSLHKCESNMLG
jgi:hypothetical protein